MAVLSSSAVRPGWHRTSVPVGTALHALLLLVLFGGIRNPPTPPDPPAFEMIEIAAAPQPEPQPAEEPPPAAPVVAADAPLPMEAQDEPVSPPLDPTPAPPQEAELAPAPEPQVQTAAAVEPDVPTPAVQAPVSPALPAAPKPVRLLTTHAFVVRPTPQQTVVPAAPPQAAQNAPPTAMTGTAEAAQHAEASLRGRIRNAVQAAVRCPAAARMMALSGKAGVAFDYRDGVLIGGVQLTRSTGTPMLDAAALAAVRDAHYPDPPPEAANHLLRFLVWVEEACGG